MQQISKNHHQTSEWETDKTPQNPKKISRRIWRVIIWICIILAVCYAVYFASCKFFISTVEITGHSMQQTIFDGDKVVLNNENYEPKQGDIVVIAENGTQLDTAIIKRVIAVAGQTVDIDFHRNRICRRSGFGRIRIYRKRQYYKGRRNAISTDGSGKLCICVRG